ncbi:GNAT family N-acetyltransferase [Pseudonocardia sp. GCM10023141]|uniref:GNAT family N-acetyltransferase n=1 Tax=Pseudonocardia sp. GCM10023141 TaxID=3252653 RepID=UPI00360EB3C0
MHIVEPAELPALRHRFAPERPGPMIFEQVVASGLGSCRTDRRQYPRVVIAEIAGNYALRGDPAHLPAGSGIRGLVEASPAWLPALRAIDPQLGVWNRIVHVLPDAVPTPPSSDGVRLLGRADTAAIAALDRSLDWISESWGGPAGPAAAGVARGAFDGERLVAVATPFFVGTTFVDIGVVTEEGHRGRGLSTACTAAVIADVRADGQRPCWTTSPDNTASAGVATRSGFVLDRTDVLYAVGVPIPD